MQTPSPVTKSTNYSRELLHNSYLTKLPCISVEEVESYLDTGINLANHWFTFWEYLFSFIVKHIT